MILRLLEQSVGPLRPGLSCSSPAEDRRPLLSFPPPLPAELGRGHGPFCLPFHVVVVCSKNAEHRIGPIWDSTCPCNNLKPNTVTVNGGREGGRSFPISTFEARSEGAAAPHRLNLEEGSAECRQQERQLGLNS